MDLLLAAWSCCFKLRKQMSSFLSIYFKSRNVIQFIVQYWAYIWVFCSFLFWAVPALRPGGIAPHLVP